MVNELLVTTISTLLLHPAKFVIVQRSVLAPGAKLVTVELYNAGVVITAGPAGCSVQRPVPVPGSLPVKVAKFVQVVTLLAKAVTELLVI
jgi:hypothetical protein